MGDFGSKALPATAELMRVAIDRRRRQLMSKLDAVDVVIWKQRRSDGVEIVRTWRAFLSQNETCRARSLLPFGNSRIEGLPKSLP